MARLPVPGSDDNVWGDVLNQYLSVSLDTDGTLKSDTINGAAIQDNSISAPKLTSNAVTAPKLSTPSAPSNGQVLSYNGSSLSWTNVGAGGEVNTASNVGTSGVGVFKQKSGLNLEFKSINAASSRVIVTNDAANDEVDIDVDTAQLGLTKSDVGLANVDNTSDANKPISTATQTALNIKANTATTVTGATSLTGGGDLSANRTLSLVNDSATPGNSHYYGTDGTGTKGYHAMPSQDPTLGGDLTGTASNAQIAAGAIVNADINASAAIAQSKIANLTTDLAGKEPTIASGTTAQYWRGDKSWQTLDKTAVGLANVDNTSDANKPISTATQTALNAKLDDKNEIVALTDSTNDRFVRVNITDDASPTSGWVDRLAFYFSGVRTGYHNEYGELRARPAKNNTVAFRALGWNGASSADILQVADTSQSTIYLGVSATQIALTVPLTSTANITTTGTVSAANMTTTGNMTATGTVTGSNIGNKVTTSATAPSSPSVGDVWIDTST